MAGQAGRVPIVNWPPKSNQPQPLEWKIDFLRHLHKSHRDAVLEGNLLLPLLPPPSSLQPVLQKFRAHLMPSELQGQDTKTGNFLFTGRQEPKTGLCGDLGSGFRILLFL